MATHTGHGDNGFTDLPSAGGGLRRARKDQPAFEALGTLDELSSWLGMCLVGAPDDAPVALLADLQPRLLTLTGELLGYPPGPGPSADEDLPAMIERIHDLEAQLPPLTGFVLPGGSESACRLHVARTVCRRAERAVIAAFDLDQPAVARTVRWLNTLGDLLFVLARQARHRHAP